jgi:hypothetical protein
VTLEHFYDTERPEREQIGTGDGATDTFYYGLRGPVVPGSVFVRVLAADAVSQLGDLNGDITNFESAMCDVGRDGVLHGDVYCGSSPESRICYDTGALTVKWMTPPIAGAPIVCGWSRKLHRLRKSKIQVQLPNGQQEWVSLHELGNAIALEPAEDT